MLYVVLLLDFGAVQPRAARTPAAYNNSRVVLTYESSPTAVDKRERRQSSLRRPDRGRDAGHYNYPVGCICTQAIVLPAAVWIIEDEDQLHCHSGLVGFGRRTWLCQVYHCGRDDVSGLTLLHRDLIEKVTQGTIQWSMLDFEEPRELGGHSHRRIQLVSGLVSLPWMSCDYFARCHC